MNILLIEDDDLVANMLTRLLSKRGHTVTRVTGIEGAKIYIGHCVPFDLVITDRDVPDGDAWIFVRQAVGLKQLTANVIFMSGRIPDHEPERFWLKGGEPASKLLELVHAAP